MPCNQVRNDTELKEIKSSNKLDQKFMLKCNEKCETKLKKNETEEILPKNDKNKEEKKANNVYFLFGFLIICISMLIVFLNKNSYLSIIS